MKPDDKVMAGGYTGGRCAAWRPVSFATCNCHFKFLPNVLGLLSKPLGNFIRKVQGSSITVPRMFDGHELKSRVGAVGLFLVLVCAAIAAVAAFQAGPAPVLGSGGPGPGSTACHARRVPWSSGLRGPSGESATP